MPVEVVAGGWIGVMGVDPGGTSGVAWGVFDLEADTMADCVASSDEYPESRGAVEVPCMEDWVDGAQAIWNLWTEFTFRCRVEGSVDCVLVVEDFILTKLGSSEREGLHPVRIGGVLEYQCRETGDEFVMYSASIAKSKATSARMRHWGMWARGMPHARDAQKQVLTHLGVLR